MATDLTQLQIENPEKTSVGLMRFNKYDLVMSGVLLTGTIYVLKMYGALAGLGALLASLFILWRFTEGRTYYLFIMWWANLWVSLGRHGWIWRSSTFRQEQGGRQVLPQAKPFPFDIYELRDDSANLRVGTIFNKKSFTDTIAVIGSGSDMIALSYEGQQLWIEQLANRVEAIMGEQESVKIEVSYLLRRRPANLHTLYGGFAQDLHPQVIAPSGMAKPEQERTEEEQRWVNLHLNLRQLIDVAAEYPEDTMMVTLWTISRVGELAKAGKSKKGKGIQRRRALRLPVIRLTHSVLSSLHDCGVASPTVLDSTAIQRFLRESWDVTNIRDYHEWEALQAATQTPTEGNIPPLPPEQTEPHWPSRYVRAHRKFVDIDGNLHAVLRLTGMPLWTMSHVLRQIDHTCYADGRPVRNLSRALVSEAGNSTYEYLLSGLWLNARETMSDVLSVRRQRPKSQERTARTERQEQAAADNRVLQRFCLLVDVAVPGPANPANKQDLAQATEELTDAIEAIQASAKGLGLQPVNVKGAARILAASLTACTGIDLL